MLVKSETNIYIYKLAGKDPLNKSDFPRVFVILVVVLEDLFEYFPGPVGKCPGQVFLGVFVCDVQQLVRARQDVGLDGRVEGAVLEPDQNV